MQHADCAFSGGDVERAREAEHGVGVHGSGDGKGEPELGVGGEGRAALDAEEIDEGGGVCRERLFECLIFSTFLLGGTMEVRREARDNLAIIYRPWSCSDRISGRHAN